MKDKKIPSNKPRTEIIADNIFKYLEQKQLKQKDLAEVCLVNPSDVSKWKNYKTKINIDDFEKIANFLKVSIKDLYYSDEEKKRGVPELSEKIDPSTIYAQRLAEVTFGAPVNNIHFIMVIGNAVFMFCLLLFISLFNNKNGMNLLISWIYILGMLWLARYNSHKETFVVNYMSDVFYKLENEKNQFFVCDLITKIFSTIYSIGIGIVLCWLLNKNYQLILFVITLFNTFYFMISIINLFDLRKKYKNEIYFWEFKTYWHKYLGMIFSSVLVVFFIYMYMYYSYPTTFIILSCIDLFIRIIEYCLGSKKCSEYKVAIIDENKKISYL